MTTTTASPVIPDYASRAPAAESPAGTAAPAALSARLMSLDVFRGITIVGMLLVNYPGSGESFAPLEHAPWHGWTPTDLIFPFFLFIVGVAIPFSMAKRRATIAPTRGQLLGQILLRALSLFMLGELLTGISWQPRTPLPSGHAALMSLRIFSQVFILASIFALLTPLPRRIGMWIPPIVAVVFYLLVIGMFYANRHSGLPADFDFGGGIFRPDRLRIPGVLQRIGLCYGVAATIALFAGVAAPERIRGRLTWWTILLSSVVLMSAYSVIMLKVRLPNHVTGSLSMQDNVARYVDEKVFDKFEIGPDGKRHYLYRHTYSAYPDNEGILSTMPAIATPLLGILVGLWLRRPERTMAEKCAGLLAVGVFVAILGECLSSWLMPINKNLWTPSFVVFTAGLGMLGLGASLWLIDVRGRRRWALPFAIYGMNAIAAFVAAGLLVRLAGVIKVLDRLQDRKVSLTSYVDHHAVNAIHQTSAWMQSHHLFAIDTPGITALGYPIILILVVLAMMSVLYALKIFVKV